MHSLVTLVRKRPEVTTERFRHFMEHEYGPAYVSLPQTRRYVQTFVTDPAGQVDAIVEISFDDEAAMRDALDTDAYRGARDAREAYMLDIHPVGVDRSVQLVQGP
ncbi:hypothetical protein [Actinoplanes sp. NPDC051411]|uniref:hypothetical protein n=1 Tax=Actinoplanes sp. NPDC051411 TaxID=3155522 RepID=UPI00344AE78B